jgi:hypothetical protein
MLSKFWSSLSRLSARASSAIPCTTLERIGKDLSPIRRPPERPSYRL